MEGLQAHPGEDTEQEVVENGSSDPAGGWGALRAAPDIDQEGKIQEKQADAQSHVDLRGIFRLEPLQIEPGREELVSSPKEPQPARVPRLVYPPASVPPIAAITFMATPA